jgi:hypothetical protein
MDSQCLVYVPQWKSSKNQIQTSNGENPAPSISDTNSGWFLHMANSKTLHSKPSMSTCYNVENYLNTTVETPLSRSFPIISSSLVYEEKEKNHTTVCCRTRYSPSSLQQQPAIEREEQVFPTRNCSGAPEEDHHNCSSYQ